MRHVLSQIEARAHSWRVKPLVSIVFLVLVASLALDASRMAGIVDITVPQLLPTKHKMATVTFTALLPDGISTITLTVTQHEGETDDQFASRAARLWAAMKAANGL